MKKYELTKETIKVNGRTLYRIRRLCDGLLGGYIESENNLSQYGSCFVYDRAKVYGSAWVYGSALVSGSARVSGNARFDKTAYAYFKYPILVGPEWICIGCESHSLEHWRANIDKIGKNHGYTPNQVKITRHIIRELLRGLKK